MKKIIVYLEEYKQEIIFILIKRLLTLMNEEWHWIQTTKQGSWKILLLQQTKVRPSILMFSQAVFYKKNLVTIIILITK